MIVQKSQDRIFQRPSNPNDLPKKILKPYDSDTEMSDISIAYYNLIHWIIVMIYRIM